MKELNIKTLNKGNDKELNSKLMSIYQLYFCIITNINFLDIIGKAITTYQNDLKNLNIKKPANVPLSNKQISNKIKPLV